MAVLILLSACALGSLPCGEPELRSIARTWETLMPEQLASSVQPGFTVSTERMVNTAGATFVNVLLGGPQARGCKCCDTYSFEASEDNVRLVSFVATRHVRTADEAVDLAETLWAATSDEPLRLASSSLEAPYSRQSVIQTANSRRHLVELLVSRDETTHGFVVRVHVGDSFDDTLDPNSSRGL